VVLEGFNRQKWEEKMGIFYSDLYIWFWVYSHQFRTSIKFVFLHIWFIFLKKTLIPAQHTHVCTLTCTLDWFQVLCDSSGFPTRVSVVWKKRYPELDLEQVSCRYRTPLNEPTVSYVNPNLILSLGFLLNQVWTFAVFLSFLQFSSWQVGIPFST
jgi:hypothetical protein